MSGWEPTRSPVTGFVFGAALSVLIWVGALVAVWWFG